MKPLVGGGPAYPADFDYIGSNREVANGATLRDYFAAKAPPYTTEWFDSHCRSSGWCGPAEAQARWAFQYADAMLEVRSQPQG